LSISRDSIRGDLVLPWLIASARRLCLDLLQRRNVSARIETMVVNEAPPASPEEWLGSMRLLAA
jgi:DNA-directed RNA polymerase specialized sigma24 family protein